MHAWSSFMPYCRRNPCNSHAANETRLSLWRGSSLRGTLLRGTQPRVELPSELRAGVLIRDPRSLGPSFIKQPRAGDMMTPCGCPHDSVTLPGTQDAATVVRNLRCEGVNLADLGGSGVTTSVLIQERGRRKVRAGGTMGAEVTGVQGS